MRKAIGLITLLLGIGLSVYAQKAGADFSKAYNAYLSEYLSIDFEVRVFTDASDQTGTVTGTGMIRKAGSEYYSKFGSNEMVFSRNGALSIDHERKRIRFSKNNPLQQAAKANQFMMDTMLLENADSVVYMGLSSGKKKYCVYTASEPVYKCEMLFDANTGFITEVVQYYNDSNPEEKYDVHKMVITYKSVSTSKVSSSWFSTGKYISHKGNITVPTGDYSSYKLNVIDSN